ncbi:proliferation marker protein Ki-67-like [Oscarella lobularis]|uniref:proliferation marker protein Ki-67-like n=1 Tax=Oscarella lobularis TaxID=121494 RepID=UPI003313EA77
MSVIGNVVIIHRNGRDGRAFPISADICLFGRDRDCDIRVQLPKVAQEHAKLTANAEKTFDIENLSNAYDTYVNDKPLTGRARLAHKDMIKIADRYFRFEYPGENVPVASPLKEIPSSKQKRRTPTPPRKPKPKSSNSFRPLAPLCEEGEGTDDVISMETDSVDVTNQVNDVDAGSAFEPRRSIRFGPMLSPEYFDKHLPPKMPVKLGRTPDGRRRSSPGFLKTPKRSQIRRKTLDPPHLDFDDEKMDEADSSKIDRSAVPKRMATPMRKEIEEGLEMKATKKRMATPMREEIESGVPLKETKMKMATPVRKEIEEGVELRPTKKRLYTPLRKEIESGTALKETKKRMATPMRKEIEKGTELRETKKKMATPVRKEIEAGITLKETKKRLATPVRKEIQEGLELRPTKKRMETPMREEIEEGIELRKTKKKLATPVRTEIESGVTLKQTKKRMATPMRKEIEEGLDLRKTKQKMATPVRKEIKAGVALRKTKKRLATPMRKEIQKGFNLKPTRKRMNTPMRKEIEEGLELKTKKKRMLTPLRKAIAQGLQLKTTKRKMATPMRNEIKAGISLKKKKRLATPIREEIGRVAARSLLRRAKRKMQTPLRKAIEGGMTLRRAAQKKAAAIERVKMVERIPFNETVDGSEIMRSTVSRKKAEIAGRKVLKGVRRLKKPPPTTTTTTTTKPVFRFTGASGRKSSDFVMSPVAKRACLVEEKAVATEINVEDVYEANLFKTPQRKSKNAQEDVEANFCPTMFATPKWPSPLKEKKESLSAFDGLTRLFRMPKMKNDASPEKNFESALFAIPDCGGGMVLRRSARNRAPSVRVATAQRVTRATRRRGAAPAPEVATVPEPAAKVTTRKRTTKKQAPVADAKPVAVEVTKKRTTRKQTAALAVETMAEQAAEVTTTTRRRTKRAAAAPESAEENPPTLRRSARVRSRTAAGQDVAALMPAATKSTRRGKKVNVDPAPVAMDIKRSSRRLVKKNDENDQGILKAPENYYVTPERPKRKRTTTISFNDVVEHKLIPKRRRKY